MTKTFSVSTKVWLYPGAAAWHFVTVPKETSDEIDFYFSHMKGGFGSLKVLVTVGETQWKTSIFTDKKRGGFLLPLKKDVRKKENIHVGDTIHLDLEIKS